MQTCQVKCKLRRPVQIFFHFFPSIAVKQKIKLKNKSRFHSCFQFIGLLCLYSSPRSYHKRTQMGVLFYLFVFFFFRLIVFYWLVALERLVWSMECGTFLNNVCVTSTNRFPCHSVINCISRLVPFWRSQHF